MRIVKANHTISQNKHLNLIFHKGSLDWNKKKRNCQDYKNYVRKKKKLRRVYQREQVKK